VIALGSFRLLVVRRGGLWQRSPPRHPTWRRSATFTSSSFDVVAWAAFASSSFDVVAFGSVHLLVIRRGGVGQPSPPRHSTWRRWATFISSSFDMAALGNLHLLVIRRGCVGHHSPPRRVVEPSILPPVWNPAQGIGPPRAFLPLFVVALPPRRLGAGSLGPVYVVAVAVGVEWSAAVEKKRIRRRRATVLWLVFLDARRGPPTAWVPPGFPPSHIHPSSERQPAHIPLERGGARLGRMS
jgi:hypothetical protein